MGIIVARFYYLCKKSWDWLLTSGFVGLFNPVYVLSVCGFVYLQWNI